MKILDHGSLEFVESWGSDERIVEAARMSTGKGFLGWEPGVCPICDGAGKVLAESAVWDVEPDVVIEDDSLSLIEGELHIESTMQPCGSCEGKGKIAGDINLIRRLWVHKHATPFEMAGMIVEVGAPIMVFREWHRHRTQCLSGEIMIACVSPAGSTYKRSIRSIYDLKHGGVLDTAPALHKNGHSSAGTPVFREARRKDAWRTRVLPNCQTRLLRVLNETSGEFTTANMADVWQSGVKEVFLLETDKGFSVRASANHPFFTDRGWVKMKDIEAGGRVARMGKVAAHERPIPPSLRQGIGVWTTMMRTRLLKDRDRCYICGNEFAAKYLTLDHVVPVSECLRMALDEQNLKPACLRCHREKTDVEQPSRVGMSRRGVRWERVRVKPILVGEEMTYDIEVDGPHHNYVANDLIVHNSYNEMSGRYIPLPDVNYVPSVERLLIGSDGKNKQAGTVKGAGVLDEEGAESFRKELKAMWVLQEKFYQKWLKRGVPKELARTPIGVGRYSRMRASANLRNWLSFLTLRMDPAAQWEIRQYANAVGDLVCQKFPRTWALFTEGKK